MTTTKTARFRVVTHAAADHSNGRHIDCGVQTHVITDEELEAARYRFETDAHAASRVARHRRLDDLERTYRGNWTLTVSEVSVEAEGVDR